MSCQKLNTRFGRDSCGQTGLNMALQVLLLFSLTISTSRSSLGCVRARYLTGEWSLADGTFKRAHERLGHAESVLERRLFGEKSQTLRIGRALLCVIIAGNPRIYIYPQLISRSAAPTSRALQPR